MLEVGTWWKAEKGLGDEVSASIEMKIVENKNGRKTILKVSRTGFLRYKTLIDSYILLYGGKPTKESSRFLYFEIDVDLLNR